MINCLNKIADFLNKNTYSNGEHVTFVYFDIDIESLTKFLDKYNIQYQRVLRYSVIIKLAYEDWKFIKDKQYLCNTSNNMNTYGRIPIGTTMYDCTTNSTYVVGGGGGGSKCIYYTSSLKSIEFTNYIGQTVYLYT